MPRLTLPDYCTRRTLLTALYEQHDSAFIRLTPTEQRVLHEYYVPSLDLDLAELKAHRQVITERHPVLPQRAGRAWARLEQLQARRSVAAPQPVSRSKRRRRPLHIRVHGVIHPDPDYRKLIRAALLIAKEQRKM